ncbi:hypothetical protein NDU88_010151 [Pleurodeles waltl]|uniref:Uncharacterized protein n=1 Tax=Pleurodeles waltl TaxID=8319 RepID=A0AAV7PV44_PLEWA|nr:hypothetical protein NDU88_010151 [Pleurodeles waltl]
MAPFCLLLALICGTVASLSDAEWDEGSDRHSRHNPPPVASFLERLKTLRTRRSEGELVHPAAALQPQGDSLYVRPEETGGVFSSHHGSVPYQREKRHVPPAVAMRGCHLGTCQTQNLASMLYRLGYKYGKDDSNKNTRDPQGYGRRRRSLRVRHAALRTTWAQHPLNT